MNILILSWRGPLHPLSGGAEQATFSHASAWVKVGHNVTIFTSSFSNGKEEETISGVRVIRRSDQYVGVKISAFFWYLFGKHEKFDLVVDEFHGIPFFTPLFVRTKILAFIHETGTQVWALNFWPFPLNLLPALLGPIIEPLVFRLFYSKIPFMTVSESTKKDLARFGVHNVTVVMNGFTSYPSSITAKKEKKFTVISLSALAQDKGTEDGIKAFEVFHKKNRNSQFWIVGKGDDKYINYLRSLSPLPRFFGFVSDQKKFSLLSKSHVLLFPSLHEGWGLVIIEANSVGLPAVAYKVPGCVDSVRDGETGLLSEKGDVFALADKLTKIATNKSLYQKLSSQAKKWSTNFSWNRSTQKSLQLITSITKLPR